MKVAVFVLGHHTSMTANQDRSVYSTRCSAQMPSTERTNGRDVRSYWTADFTNAAKALENSLFSRTMARAYIHLSRGDRDALSGSLDRIQRVASVILAPVNADG